MVLYLLFVRLRKIPDPQKMRLGDSLSSARPFQGADKNQLESGKKEKFQEANIQRGLEQWRMKIANL